MGLKYIKYLKLTTKSKSLFNADKINFKAGLFLAVLTLKHLKECHFAGSFQS